jgi:Type III secretion protein (HpaP)
MSNDDGGRQRRIVSLMPAMRAPDQGSATAPLARRFERFQRALFLPLPIQSRLSDQLAEVFMPEQAAPAAEPKTTRIKSDRPQVDADSNSNNFVIGSQTDELAPDVSLDELSKQHEYRHTTSSDDTKIAPRVVMPKWVISLADLVSHTCRQADQAFSHWSVVIPIDPAVLPDTTLRLDLSPSRLMLRFCTQSTHSLSLISKHNSNLVSLLMNSISGIENIEIDIT